MHLPAVIDVQSHEGNIVDQLLALASQADPSVQSDIYALRAATRSGRPEQEWVWSEELGFDAAAIVARPGISEGAARALTDAIGIHGHNISALAASKKWSLPTSGVWEESLELASFRTARSFDEFQSKFLEHIESKDVLSVILRGHLWVENAMNGLIARTLANPDEIAEARLTFAQKVAVARGLGRLTVGEAAASRRLNKLRNRLAHQLDAAVNLQDQAGLIEAYALDKSLGDLLRRDRDFPEGITAVIVVLVVRLHDKADDIDAHSRLEAFTKIKAERALRNFNTSKNTLS